MGEIVTVRDKDWEKIEGCFAIPEPIKEIEYQRIKLDKQQTIMLMPGLLAIPLVLSVVSG
ncbi:MAG: hypothetical protein V2A53_03510 [bacterium]